jgi:hypothetical protein
MALMTLRQAKGHLRIPLDAFDSDADVQLKVDQASAIILDYLKARPIAIASISVANPTVITTSVPHSLISGSTYTILGTTTTPAVTGSNVVTVTGAKTFTVPVNVTVGQTAAAGTIGTVSWTDLTAPGPVQAAALLVLTHLYEHRGDDLTTDAQLWEAVGRLTVRFRDPACA